MQTAQKGLDKTFVMLALKAHDLSFGLDTGPSVDVALQGNILHRSITHFDQCAQIVRMFSLVLL
jgi:hypothetical protein